jgi:predicted aldo/keto reductase-like oxidoreductase
MQYRRLGRTGLRVSAVGFGTCQLRMVPERQALETLARGFELGVNIVHTAPDYEGANQLVARAIAQTGKDVIVLPQAYDVQYNDDGPVDHFERLFEEAAETFGRERFEMFGIACLDDREAFRENVWGPRGMVEFLLEKKREGRVGGIYCTTHGDAEFVRRIIESGVFDAVMLAYNVLGFHLLSYNPPPERRFENMGATESLIFPLAAEHDVGLMIMKPLAGGLLVDGKAFPPRRPPAEVARPLAARDVLSAILDDQRIACVLPGTASLEEAEENARAGHRVTALGAALRAEIDDTVHDLRSQLCSRCGDCERTCSRQLEIPWLFRAAYVNLQPSETYETWDEVEYFALHPDGPSLCADCTDRTCLCSAGIDIPASLIRLHGDMLDLAAKGLIRNADFRAQPPIGDEMFAAKVILREVPAGAHGGERCVGRVYVENAGERGWFVDDRLFSYARVQLGVFLDGVAAVRVPLRHDTHRGSRAHFAFEFEAPPEPGVYALRLILLGEHCAFDPNAGLELHAAPFAVAVEAARVLR